MKKPLSLHHSIDYPNGVSHHGKVDHRREPKFLNLKVKNKKVLDIASNDGFFAFWCEQNGAKEVTAIDVDTYDKYDWGFSGAPKECENLKQQNKSEGFWHHHEQLRSSVTRLNLSVNELDPNEHGNFDVVINYGLLYHLRNPLLSLDKCRAVTTGMMVLESNIYPEHDDKPMCYVGWGGVTDYFLPNEACVISWLLMSDFPYVYAQKRETLKSIRKKKPNRQRFLACVSEEEKMNADNNNNFRSVNS